jgi:hypothetical protein
MTFIPVKTFDENGEFKVINKRRKILKEGEVQEDGSIKGKAEVKLEYGTLTRENLNTDVGNLAAAEVLALEEFEIFWGMGTPPLNHVDPDSHLAHRISMAAANIGDATKRGRGNTVVCHPSVRDKVDNCWDKIKTVKQYDETVDDMVDVQRPYFQEPLEVIEHDAAPEDSVLVLYRGEDETDQPLIYIEGEGLLMNSAITNVENYGKFVRVK